MGKCIVVTRFITKYSISGRAYKSEDDFFFFENKEDFIDFILKEDGGFGEKEKMKAYAEEVWEDDSVNKMWGIKGISYELERDYL
mgnify:CR=1 FL=1